MEGEPLQMELDTGSANSVLPYANYKERFREIPTNDIPVQMKTCIEQKLA